MMCLVRRSIDCIATLGDEEQCHEPSEQIAKRLMHMQECLSSRNNASVTMQQLEGQDE